MCFLADDRYKDAWSLRKKHAQIRLLGAKTYAAGANFGQRMQTTEISVQRCVPQMHRERELHRSHSVTAAKVRSVSTAACKGHVAMQRAAKGRCKGQILRSCSFNRQHCTLLPVAPSSSRKTMDSAKVASFTYGSAHEHSAKCHD